MEMQMHSYCKPASADNEEVVYCVCRSKDTNCFMICCDKCNEWYHGNCIGITERQAKSIITYYCVSCTEKDPSMKTIYKERKKPFRPPAFGCSIGPPYKKFTKSSRSCGQCTACDVRDDCGSCDFCKDMRKFGGPNKIRQKCRQRQCLIFAGKSTYAVLRDITTAQSDPSISKELKTEGDPIINVDVEADEDEDDGDDDDGDSSYLPTSSHARSRARTSRTPKKARNGGGGSSGADDSKKWHRGRRRRRHYFGYRHTSPPGSDTRRYHHRHQREEDAPRQCFGPGCQQAARKGSKYCSDDCGLKLAINRIYNILPQRIQQWNSTPCVAQENSKRQLEIVREKQISAHMTLRQLDLRSQALEALIACTKGALLAADSETDGDEEAELSVYCVTCGLEIAARTASRHMEKCFNKYESQTSFGSVYKTRIEGSYNVFCDTFNAQQGTYCKRLRVLCPEHSKEPKVSDNEVCGCPLVTNVFEETGEYCRVARKKCMKHYCWEKLRRAEIDMDRVRQWLVLDDLLEQERGIRRAMAERAGVLGLMLHSTVNQDAVQPPPPPIKGEQQSPMV